jgi:hypothetical protein
LKNREDLPFHARDWPMFAKGMNEVLTAINSQDPLLVSFQNKVQGFIENLEAQPVQYGRSIFGLPRPRAYDTSFLENLHETEPELIRNLPRIYNRVWSYVENYQAFQGGPFVINMPASGRLLAFLNAKNTHKPKEHYIQKAIRVKMQSVKKWDNPSQVGWNNSVAEFLGINTLEHRAVTQNYLPQLGDLMVSKELRLFIENSANLSLAIQSLKSLIELKSGFYSPRGPQLPCPEGLEQAHIFYNALLWKVVHFYHHIADLIVNDDFLTIYGEVAGNVLWPLRDFKQIRNYAAHVANPSYVNSSPAEDQQFYSFLEHVPDMLKAFEGLYTKWNSKLQELIDFSNDKLPPKFFKQIQYGELHLFCRKATMRQQEALVLMRQQAVVPPLPAPLP